MKKISQFFLSLLAISSFAYSAEFSVGKGWNLLGTSTDITANTVFTNSDAVVSVWSWDNATSTWKFFSPSKSFTDGGAAYAVSKGYSPLTKITAAQGFWVNAATAFSVSNNTIAAINTTVQLNTTTTTSAIQQTTTVSSTSSTTNTAIKSTIQSIGKYKNELGFSQVFNIAVADLNGDGLDDVVLSGWASSPDNFVAARSSFVNLMIFIQQSDGSLIDKTDDLIGVSKSVIWGSQRILINDYDKDGKPDIAVLGFQDGKNASFDSPSAIFWNDGNKFSRIDIAEGLWAHAACAGDINGDGFIDLAAGGSPNSIFINSGSRQININKKITNEPISTGGACSIINDEKTGNFAIITTNLPLFQDYSAVLYVFDKNFKLLKKSGLPGAEEPGLNISLNKDIVNIIKIDLNGDGIMDMILTDNGDYHLGYPNGSFVALINDGKFNFINETEKYFPNQKKNSFFNYYVIDLTLDGLKSFYVHNDNSASLWQLNGGSFVKYKESLISSLTADYNQSAIYKTGNGYSLFLLDFKSYPFATFYTRPLVGE